MIDEPDLRKPGSSSGNNLLLTTLFIISAVQHCNINALHPTKTSISTPPEHKQEKLDGVRGVGVHSQEEGNVINQQRYGIITRDRSGEGKVPSPAVRNQMRGWMADQNNLQREKEMTLSFVSSPRPRYVHVQVKKGPK